MSGSAQKGNGSDSLVFFKKNCACLAHSPPVPWRTARAGGKGGEGEGGRGLTPKTRKKEEGGEAPVRPPF